MRYLDANTYFKNRFGHKLYKAAISIDVTCPNRDGTCGVGGCIFCSAGGSGEFAVESMNSVTEQIDAAISRLQKKAGADTGYIAYFQSFTNTYCEASYLNDVLSEAARHDKVEAISVATRPDCLPQDILEVLKNINEIKPVFVELGFQTSNEKTSEWFNRGYKNQVYFDAVSALHEIGINVISHVIFGLKGESKDDMMNSVRACINAGTDGIKITSLYVLRGTKLQAEYEAGLILLPDMEEYFDLVDAALEIIPPDVVVHRITGDGPKSLLIAPMWTANKRAVINYINRRFK